MIAFSYYLLKVLICSTVLFAYYWFALRNKVFHGYNRFYLLIVIALSLTLPTLHINIQQQHFAAPANTIKMLQVVTATDDFIDDLSLQQTAKQITLEDVAPYLYMLISAIFLIALFTMLIKIYALQKKYDSIQLQNIYLVNTDAAKGTPFSFFRTIFWNNEIEINSTNGQSIFKHELAHIQQRHSYDKIFINIVLTMFWCNPIFWLIKKELNMIHEFIADKYAVEDGNTAEFASMLLAVAYPKHNFNITNHFFYSPIKRRLAMITKNKNPKVNYISRILALPILLLVFAAFTLKAKTIKDKAAIKNTYSINNEAQETNTSNTEKGLFTTIAEIFSNEKVNKKADNNASLYTNERPLIVVIDAGHGGKDDGAINKNGINEKDVALALIKKIKALNTNDNIKIILTREDDAYNTPIEKAAFAAAQNADLFISVHLNAQPSTNKVKSSGLFVFVANDKIENSIKSKVLASAVIGSFNKNYAIPVESNPKQRANGIMVLQANNIPSIIIEAGYIDNDKDLAYLQSEKGQETFATNILTAIKDYGANNFTVSAKAQMMEVDSPPVVTVKAVKENVSIDIKNIGKLTDVMMIYDELDLKKENGIYVVNNTVYKLSELKNKVIKAKICTVYKDPNQELIKKYGAKTGESIYLFENATIENSFEEKFKNKIYFTADEMKVVDAMESVTIKGQFQNSNNKPMYVIDGIEKNEAAMKDLNPNDIQSVDVLKDATAIVLYGDKGKNGVIRITTKKTTSIADSSTKKR